MYVTAGSWLIASVHTERTNVMSSTIFDVHGISSLTQAPDLPYWANLYFDGAMGKRVWPLVMVVRRWPWRIESGRSLSNRSAIFGLWSKRSICDGPSFMNR